MKLFAACWAACIFVVLPPLELIEPVVSSTDGYGVRGFPLPTPLDAARHLTPEPEKIYTWWSYRAADWSATNKGRRLDHAWVSPDLAGTVRDMTVARHVRGWDRPSDHAPVTLILEL